MGPRERIGRAVMTTVHAVKDVAVAKIVEAAAAGTIKLDQATLAQVVALVSATIETGHRQAEGVLDREIAAAIDAARLEATVETARAATGRDHGAKKKTTDS